MVLKQFVLLSCLVCTLYGSPKKGLCIPPGDNFHCGDIEAFDNVRLVELLSL